MRPNVQRPVDEHEANVTCSQSLWSRHVCSLLSTLTEERTNVKGKEDTRLRCHMLPVRSRQTFDIAADMAVSLSVLNLSPLLMFLESCT